MADEEVRFHGPLFDGRAFAELEAGTREAENAVAGEGLSMLRETFGRVFQHPTGYYESHVHTEVRGALNEVVTDGGVVYGPWLEGTGSRNRTTRFKGYASFRRVTEALKAESARIAGAAMAPFVGRMN